MIENWRVFIYPLGFLAPIAFGARLLVQWSYSEYKRESVVPRLFWHLSLTGNILLLLHATIQVQFHVALIQSCNAVISWRNLNLMLPKNRQIQIKTILMVLGATILCIIGIFLFQDLYLYAGNMHWLRRPQLPGNDIKKQISLWWHIIGTSGLALFSSRFWVQWWFAEKHRKSHLGRSFWWSSLIGASMTLGYFCRLGDPVNAIGPAMGMIPYLRNLILIRKYHAKT